jgi:hypothetical protein
MQSEWAARRWPGMSSKELEEGRRLYVDHCSNCHNVYLPSEYSLTEWDVFLSSMAARAKINDEQKNLIWRYLETSKSSPT